VYSYYGIFVKYITESKMMRKAWLTRLLPAALIVAGGLSISSCEQYSWAKQEVPQDLTVSFSETVQPFCQGCHSAWTVDRTYDKLSANVDTVTPGSSRVLSIHSSITAFGSQMLQIDTLLIPATDVIKLWASQGAEKN
jgi:hypothetical protein